MSKESFRLTRRERRIIRGLTTTAAVDTRDLPTVEDINGDRSHLSRIARSGLFRWGTPGVALFGAVFGSQLIDEAQKTAPAPVVRTIDRLGIDGIDVAYAQCPSTATPNPNFTPENPPEVPGCPPVSPWPGEPKPSPEPHVPVTPSPTASPSPTPRPPETPRPIPPEGKLKLLKFEDLDGDAVWEQGEPVLPWGFSVDGPGNNDFRTQTGVDGSVVLTVPEGQYGVCEDERHGWQAVIARCFSIFVPRGQLVEVRVANKQVPESPKPTATPVPTPRIETPPPTPRPTPEATPPPTPRPERTPPPPVIIKTPPPEVKRTPPPKVIVVVTPRPTATPVVPEVCPNGTVLPDVFQGGPGDLTEKQLKEIKCEILKAEKDHEKQLEMLKLLRTGQIKLLELLMGKDLDGDGIVGPDDNKDGKPDVPSIPERFDGLSREQIHTQELITGKDLDGDGIIGPDLNKDGQADGPSVPTTVGEKVNDSENRITQLLDKIGNGVHDIWDRVDTGASVVAGVGTLAILGAGLVAGLVAKRRLRRRFQGIDQSFVQVDGRFDQLAKDVQGGFGQLQQTIAGLQPLTALGGEGEEQLGSEGDNGGPAAGGEDGAGREAGAGAGVESPEPGGFTEEQIQILATGFEFLDRIFNTVDELSDSQITRKIRAAKMTEEQMNAFRQALIQSIMILSEEDEEELNKLSPVRLIRRLSARRGAISQAEALRIATVREQLRAQAAQA